MHQVTVPNLRSRTSRSAYDYLPALGGRYVDSRRCCLLRQYNLFTSSQPQEIHHWLPSFRVLRFHAQESERARLKLAVRDGKVDFDICVTTYEGYAAEDSWFKSRRWTYLVLDEGHKIKNSETRIAHKVQGIGSMYRLSELFCSFA